MSEGGAVPQPEQAATWADNIDIDAECHFVAAAPLPATEGDTEL